MHTTALTHSSAGSVGRGVWERAWKNEPTDAKDARLLDRERRGPRWQAIVEQLEQTFGTLDGLRTVELGSGRGDLSVLLAQRGAVVTLLDYTPGALTSARRRFQRLGLSGEFVQGDMLGSLAEQRGRFDVALSSGVIEHFKGTQRTQVVQAHRHVLRQGGIAIISVPHAWCLPYRLWKGCLELRGWWPYGMDIPYSKRELTDRARRAGFVRTAARTMCFWQSVGDHCGRGLFGRGPDWIQKVSWLDRFMGVTLLLFAWRDGDRELVGADGEAVCP